MLSSNPYDITLHAQHVRLARETGMDDQLEAALDMLTTFWAAGDYAWLPLLDMKIKSADLETGEGISSVLELFEKAEGDYSCAYAVCSTMYASPNVRVCSNCITPKAPRVSGRTL